MPGMDANEVEVKLANGIRTTGEKKEAKEEREKNGFLSKRRYGASSAASGCRPVSMPTTSTQHLQTVY